MPGLLVSVRSAEEARAAVLGGATVIDVKEPNHGPLGRASAEVVRQVREAVPASIPVSMALGELAELKDEPVFGPDSGISFRKLGLAGAGPHWELDWANLRRKDPDGPRWVAVVYSDWEIACAPEPDQVVLAALAAPEIVGVLVDTWDKSRPGTLELTENRQRWVRRIQSSGRFVALAGRLDLPSLARLSPLCPDLFAVRGAACLDGDRGGTVDAGRVAELVQALGTPDGTRFAFGWDR